MIFSLFRRHIRADTISTLYGTIVAHARLPCFYRDYEIADTVNGRFELLILHLAVILDRLMADPQLRDVGQGLFDHFCSDMDHNLREMGVGDLAVPRQMQRVGEAFYGRAQAYRGALALKTQEMLTEALERNVYGNGGSSRAAAARLAVYIVAVAAHLRDQPTTSLLAGKLDLPDPASMVGLKDRGSSVID
ncbi:MAG TPA: ubiquinol-cytochrome C chaperone family protein [Pseudolabrys sp.]|jgi:cytochrome b pre-mRNA-processing protein 3